MIKIYLHCGDFQSAPADAIILGDLTLTGAQMSQIGRNLRAPETDEVARYFSNSAELAYGVRRAIREGAVSPDSFAFVFHGEGELPKEIKVGREGDLQASYPGFFDQAEIDLLKLL